MLSNKLKEMKVGVNSPAGLNYQQSKIKLISEKLKFHKNLCLMEDMQKQKIVDQI